MSKIPHFLDSRLIDGGEVISLSRRPLITPPPLLGSFAVLIFDNLRAVVGLEKLSRLEEIQYPDRKSNPRPSGLYHIASTNYAHRNCILDVSASNSG
jgi:hypothetical protein